MGSKEQIEKIIHAKLSAFKYELPKDEFSNFASELAEIIATYRKITKEDFIRKGLTFISESSPQMHFKSNRNHSIFYDFNQCLLYISDSYGARMLYNIKIHYTNELDTILNGFKLND